MGINSILALIFWGEHGKLGVVSINFRGYWLARKYVHALTRVVCMHYHCIKMSCLSQSRSILGMPDFVKLVLGQVPQHARSPSSKRQRIRRQTPSPLQLGS